jgi:uncharacterized iron-regulated membrane protein
MKRWLFIVHRWLGVVLCLFMAMWFVSGVVMMYVGYPKLTDGERLAALPALPVQGALLTPAGAAAAAAIGEAPRTARLTTVAGVPHYVFGLDRGRLVAVDAARGSRVDAVDADRAVASAAAFVAGAAASTGITGSPAAALRYRDSVQEDAWTHSRALDPHRPLHRVEAGNAGVVSSARVPGTLLYVSSRTGEVVRDATPAERTWNWVGAWIHWLYPLRGGALDAWWHDVVVWGSVAATVLAVIGMVLGVLRWRFGARYRSGARTPYREPWLRWHHLTGLVFGVLTVTWIFSGLMSMNPWRVFASPPLPGASSARLDLRALDASVAPLLARFAVDGFAPRELEWRWFEGAPLLVAYDGVGRTRLARPAEPGAAPFERLSFDALAAAGTALMPGVPLRRQVVVERHDLWYYARAPHTMLGHVERRLPILRLEFDDPAGTWLQLDPHTGALVGRLDERQRIKRWLFAMLHSWDWLPLLERRPLWDALMIVASAGGLAVSLTGVVLGWRRLRRKARAVLPAAGTRLAADPGTVR